MKPILAALALAAVTLAGCGSACQDLASRICDCQPSGTLRDSCNSIVKAQLNAASPSGDDQAYCQKLLGTCPSPATDVGACDALKTEAGKQACGMAY
jgi:hypothetical protein